MIITILTDNKNSWFVKYGFILKDKLQNMKHDAYYVFDKENIMEGDVCFLLSCSRIVQNKYIQRNEHNIVVHASDLPKGKGFSPLQWQILESKDKITLTLFEAVEEVDAGPYYLKSEIEYNGTELYKELREILARKIIEMCVKYVKNINNLEPIQQSGEESFYRKRKHDDDEIDPNKSIIEQFNHYRIADNERFPLFFYYKKIKYYIKIEKGD